MDTIDFKNALIDALMEIRMEKTPAGYTFRTRGGCRFKDNITKPMDPRSMKHRNDFGVAMTSSKLLRQALKPILSNFSSRLSIKRTNSAIWRIVLSDKINDKGKKNAFHGDNAHLKNLELNPHASLHTLLFVNPTSTIDREKGIASLFLPSFNPIEYIKHLKGATHFKIVSAAIELNFLKHDFHSSFLESEYLPFEYSITKAISHEHQMKANTIHPLILVLGLQYFQKVNGVYYQLLERTRNGICIINFSQVSDEVKMTIKK